MTGSRAFIAALLLACAPQFAAAQPPLSLKETRVQAAEAESLGKEVAYTNSVCGLSMSAAVDWQSADAWPDVADLVAQCDLALGAVETACRAGGPPPQIASLTRFVCAGDGSGPSIRARTFRFGAARGGDSFERTRVFLDGLR